MEKQIVDYFNMLEDSIARLPLSEREQLYRPCAENCVKQYVLKEQKRMFEECNHDLDLMYTRYPKSEFFFSRIIEKGHIYEMGYPRCLCFMNTDGLLKNPVHCECSRQSVLYVLHELMPDKKIQVETICTVLSGADECTFRITID